MDHGRVLDRRYLTVCVVHSFSVNIHDYLII
jgi:hypothetical protein